MNAKRQHLINSILNTQQNIWQSARRHPPTEWLTVDLTMQQLKTLFLLYSGSATMNQLASSLGVRQATVTGIIDCLLAQGLVWREEDPNDRRLVVCRLTDEGYQLMSRLYTAVQIHMTEILDRLSTEDLRTVAQAMDILCSALTKEDPL